MYQPEITQELFTQIQRLSKTSNREIYTKVKALEEIFVDQEHYIEKLQKENSFLKKYDKRNSLENQQKDKIIEQQSRLAAMGEMIDAIAHQWKQPLNAISMMIDMLRDDFKTGDVDHTYIDDLDKSVQLQIEHMVTTLNEFRNFLRPSTKNKEFSFNTILQKVQILMKDELIAQNLHLHLDIDENLRFFGNENEFKHLFINLINNAIDAFNEQGINIKEMYIRAFAKEKEIIIEVEDEAGGIPTNIINHIFKPNVTTKPEGKGTGIGLYMSMQIVQKNNGTLEVENVNKGALFRIKLPNSSV